MHRKKRDDALRRRDLRVLAWLGRWATVALAIGAVLGLMLPNMSNLLEDFFPIMVFVFTTASFLKIDGARLASAWQRPALPGLLIFWALIVSPLAVALAVWLFAVPEKIGQAVVLMAASPPMIAAVVFALLLKLDAALAISVTVIGMLLMPVTVPPLFQLLTGLSVEIDVLVLALRIAGFIALAALIAWIIRALIGYERIVSRSEEINGVTVIVLVAFGASLMPVVRERLISDPLQIALFVSIAFAVNLALQAATRFAFAWSGGLHSTTSALLAGNRNMSIVCANLGAAATPEIMLLFVSNLIPMYTLPWMLRRLYALASSGKN